MKQKLLILLTGLLMSISVFAQPSAKETDMAIEFNDYCAIITDSLHQFGGNWGEELSKALETKNFKNLSQHQKKLSAFIDRKHAELSSKKLLPEMEGLRKATLDFLNFEGALVKSSFLPFEKLNVSSSEQEIEKVTQQLIEASSLEEAKLNDLRMAQFRLAEHYGFTITEE